MWCDKNDVNPGRFYHTFAIKDYIMNEKHFAHDKNNIECDHETKMPATPIQGVNQSASNKILNQMIT